LIFTSMDTELLRIPGRELDPTNTTLFIGGLSSQVAEEQLRAVFSQFGDIIYVKIPQGKGCGFVQFVLRASAEQAMAAMNGRILGNSAMRISWGRSSSRSASQPGQGLPGLGVGGYGAAPTGLDSQVLDQMLAASVAAAGYTTNPQQSLGNGSSLIPNQYLSSFAKVSLPLDLPADIFSAYMNAQNSANR
jgi:RNA recognition motif-containing protein